METGELLPCPFCGEKVYWAHGYVAHVDAYGGMFSPLIDCPIRTDRIPALTLSWNRRSVIAKIKESG